MHYACILGCNDDWCEQRPSLGDIGLAKCLLKCGLPKDNLLELYDEYATRSSILSALEELLDRRNNNRKEEHHQTKEDSLLFYYGGHGIRSQFCTHTGGGEPQIRHSDIIELLERKFHSGVAWIILDCCHSGSFGEAVLAHKENAEKLNVQYGCIMSVAPDDKAGMEWTMTECLIKAFQCELSLFPCDGNARHYTLSTINGKHPIKENSIQQITERQTTASSHPSWEQVIDFLADEMARIKGDRLTNLFIGEGMEDGSILKRPCLFGRDESQPSPTQHELQQNEKQIIPRNLTWTENDHFHRNKFSVNDGVDVKWCGPVKKGDKSKYLIGWFRGRIRSSDEKVVVISFCDAISECSWTASLPIDSPYFLFGLPFGFGFNTQHCTNAVSRMAAQLCYLDTSVAPFTKVDVLWSDGKVYEGETVMSWSDMDHSLEELEEKKDVAGGPLMTIYWAEEDSISLEPSSNCRIKDEASSSLRPADFAKKLSIQSQIDIKTPLQAMLRSIEKAGKKLLSELPTSLTNGCNQGYRLEAYDADEDCIWLPIQVINIDPTLLPLKVLASHMCYQEAGDYITVFWEQDSTLSLIPISFLRTKKTEDGSNSDDSSKSSEEENNNCEVARDAADVRRYIEESARDILKQAKREKSCSRIRLVCVNDVYSFDDLDCNDESVRGGWSRATTLMKEMRSDPSFDTALTIVNGDVLGGSSLLQHCQGKVAIETMNAIPVDLAVLGNHEFDYGDEVLKQRLNESTFDWLGSNVYYHDEEGRLGFFPGVLGNGIIHTVGVVKLGFFGLVTKSTPKISSPSANVVFDADILSVARKTASSLRSRGADVIIAITHMSEEEDKLLASDKIAGVNLVLGGHEHESLAVMVHRDEEQEDVRDEQNDGGVLLLKCGMNCNWVGCVDLDIAHSNKDVTSISTSWSMNAVTKRTKEDKVVSDVVKKYRKKTDQESLVASFGRETAETLSLDDVVATVTPSNGSLSLSLDTRMSSVRRREATGGNVVADAMHWLIETNIGSSATGPVLAMINGGFIRGDRQYPPGSDFTVRHILKELPFPRTMEVLEIRGAAMREAMRQQLQGSSKGPTGAFPHLSSNSKLEYVTSDDDDVSIITFKVNGVEVDDDQRYIIGVTSFVADGNEGCKSWLESVRVQNKAWNDVFISKVLLQYLSCHRNISPSIEGRVKRR